MNTYIVTTDSNRVYEVQAAYYRILETGTQFIVEEGEKQQIVALFANADVLSIVDPKHVSLAK